MSEEDFWQKMDAIWGDDGRFFDREGNSIRFQEWALLFDNKDYQVIRQTKVGVFLISTVWLGMDHGIFGPEPLIFETMIINESGGERDFLDEQYRYSTEEDALAHHDAIVAQALLLEGVNADQGQGEETGLPAPMVRRELRASDSEGQGS
jgi:hypothetical protein